MLKKSFISILILITVLAAAFYSLGIIFPKLELSTRVEINKPISVVWDYFIDENNMGKWMPGFQRIEIISGQPHTVGSQYKMYFVEDDREVILTETMTAYQPQKLFAFKLHNEMINDDVAVTFTYEDGKTIITQKDNISGKSLFWRSMFVLMQSHMHQQTLQYYENLKNNLER